MAEGQIIRQAAPEVPAAKDLRDGLYKGSSADAALELRLDGAAGLASADILRIGPGGAADWVASLRTAPGAGLAQGSRVPMIAEDGLGAIATGYMTITAPNGSLDVELRLESPLNGVPGNARLHFSVSHVSDTFRELNMEIETEAGVARPAPVRFRGQDVSIESCLQAAGFAVGRAGRRSRIPAKPKGWDVATLHALMQDFAQASLDRRAWELHLLLLGRAREPNLLGVMFDETEVLPRQGLAVFASAIRGIPGIDHDRKLIQTCVHEAGHALNLAHRFERVVGRADSPSFMNYDWRYKGGDMADEFWERFAFAFDADELSFLRHGPRLAVIPGGASFHSRSYWSEGTGGYSAYVPEAPLEGFALTLREPGGGRLFQFGQPVFLEVTLTNRTGSPVDISPAVLDPKAGLLELLVRRTHGTSTRSLAEAEPFQPILQRCFDVDPGAAVSVTDGGSVSGNVNLTYGTSGFPFAEPGGYEVTALLAVFDSQTKRDLIVRSRPLPIRVASPQTIHEDRDAMELFRDDVGVYLALGGNRTLEGAHDTLASLVEERDARGAEADPVVAAIVRAQALDARREYVRYREGEFQTLPADEDRAAALLGRLDERALRAFDPYTAEQTRRLAAG
jgi:hypothetical protein